MNSYILLMSGKAQEWKALGAEENQRLMQKYVGFVEMLKSAHGFVDGSQLREGGFELNAVGKAINVDGPFAETKEVLNGYMIYKAPNFQEALALAKQCPALTHGETMQVFEIGGHS